MYIGHKNDVSIQGTVCLISYDITSNNKWSWSEMLKVLTKKTWNIPVEMWLGSVYYKVIGTLINSFSWVLYTEYRVQHRVFGT
jgi:hypothetical protein